MVGTTPTAPPQRTEEHVTDTLAVRTIQSCLPGNWVERSTDDRDYGIDLLLEHFDGSSPTGRLFLFQVKGTKATFGDVAVKLSVPVKTLLYARMFHAPFFLVHVSLADRRAYFVWLQKYIDIKVHTHSPDWDRQAEVVIHFPMENDLMSDEGQQKLDEFLRSTAHRDQGITFSRHLVQLWNLIHSFYSVKDAALLTQAHTRLQEIRRLKDFLSHYDDGQNRLDLDRLGRVLGKAAAFNCFDHDEDHFVDKQVAELLMIQTLFLSQGEGDYSDSDPSDPFVPY